MVLINVSNPTAPQRISEYTDGDDEFIRFYVPGDLCYVACLQSGFKVLNISDPYAITEIDVFNELKKKVEKTGKEEAKDDLPSYSELADRIIEGNRDRIKGYRLIDFHPDAEEEAKHLLGAITEFYYEVWGKINEIIRTLGLKGTDDVRLKLENDFTFFAIPVRGSYSRAVEDYVLTLSRKNPADNEKAAVNFMRFGGILLNNCLRVVNDGLSALEAMPESDLENGF